jgi:hypothetical protein
MKYAMVLLLGISTVSFAGEPPIQGDRIAVPDNSTLAPAPVAPSPEVPKTEANTQDSEGTAQDSGLARQAVARNQIGLPVNEPITEPFSKVFSRCAADCQPDRYVIRSHRNFPSCVPLGRAINLFSIKCGIGEDAKIHTATEGGRFADVLTCLADRAGKQRIDGNVVHPGLKVFYINPGFRPKNKTRIHGLQSIYRNVGYISMGCSPGDIEQHREQQRQNFRW